MNAEPFSISHRAHQYVFLCVLSTTVSPSSFFFLLLFLHHLLFVLPLPILPPFPQLPSILRPSSFLLPPPILPSSSSFFSLVHIVVQYWYIGTSWYVKVQAGTNIVTRYEIAILETSIKQLHEMPT